MNSISKAILLSAMGLCVNSGNVTYASIKIPDSIPKSGISTLHTHHTQIRHTLKYPNLSSRIFDERTENGIKVASVCFITDAGNCSGDKFGNLESPTGGNGGGTPNGNGGGTGGDNPNNIPEYETIPEQCRNAGYTVTSCVAGKHPVNPCPSDNTYYKECVCNENLTQTCSVPYYGVGVSCNGKYASCQRDDDKACRNAGYTQTASCPTLQVPNQKCPYNASYYDKCVCQSGLVTCSSPQIGVGTSCGGKYQSCQCPSSYKSCDCGGAVGATSCTINGTTTYSSCKSCCSDTCPSGYSKTNPGGCYEVSRTECGTTCYKSKSCCNSSSSDWCSVHSTCHGDCCKDGTLQPCDTRCGGSGCSSSGGSSSGSGSSGSDTCTDRIPYPSREYQYTSETGCGGSYYSERFSICGETIYVCSNGRSVGYDSNVHCEYDDRVTLRGYYITDDHNYNMCQNSSGQLKEVIGISCEYGQSYGNTRYATLEECERAAATYDDPYVSSSDCGPCVY